jgi:hypothetical protein
MTHPAPYAQQRERRTRAADLLLQVLDEAVDINHVLAQWPATAADWHLDESLQAAYQAVWHFSTHDPAQYNDPYYLDIQLQVLQTMATTLGQGHSLPPDMLAAYRLQRDQGHVTIPHFFRGKGTPHQSIAPRGASAPLVALGLGLQTAWQHYADAVGQLSDLFADAMGWQTDDDTEELLPLPEPRTQRASAAEVSLLPHQQAAPPPQPTYRQPNHAPANASAREVRPLPSSLPSSTVVKQSSPTQPAPTRASTPLSPSMTPPPAYSPWQGLPVQRAAHPAPQAVSQVPRPMPLQQGFRPAVTPYVAATLPTLSFAGQVAPAQAHPFNLQGNLLGQAHRF